MTLLRAAALGIATGSRSTLGLAALAVSTAPTSGSWLGRAWTRRAAVLACTGELVGDKLPSTPSRLEPPGLIARLALGGVGGALLSRREGGSPSRAVLGAAAGAAGAAAGSWLGAAGRGRAATAFGDDRPGAVIEDAAAIALASVAVR